MARTAGKIDSLVFDLDGTLVDSAPDLAAALNALLAERAAPPLTLAEIRAMIGDGTGMLVARGLAARGLDGAEDPGILGQALPRFLDLYGACLVERTRTYPGVLETLAELERGGFRMAVCTNKPFEPTRRILSALKMDRYFTTVIGGDTVATRKPEPGPLLAAVAGLEATIRRTAMIGDSATDMLCARAAGVMGILIPSDYGMPARDADLKLAGFAELPAALARY